MKQIFTTIASLCVAIASFAAQPTRTITGNITGTENWTADTIYTLSGKVYVKAGGTLNIAAGTIIKGDTAVAGSALIITRGAKIFAIGTPTKPIVFTSSAPVGKRRAGNWGGIVIAGNARINVTGGTAPFEGGNLANPDGTTTDGEYGGLNDLDNSGELKYVRIEFAGFPYQTNNELNSLTMGGVGSGTKIDYVQCSYGFDDAFEWFGGTVNAKHLIAFKTNDDDFDTDFGYRGKVQFGLVIRDTAIADASGTNGFESDNDGNSTGNTPYTSPIFSNITLVGPKQTLTTTVNSNHRTGAHVRKNSRCSIFNTLWMGYVRGVRIDGDSCHANADANLLEMQNNVVAGVSGLLLDSTAGVPWNVTNWFTQSTNNNTVYAANADAMITDAYNATAPNCKPSSGSPVLSGASFTNTKITDPFFTAVTYRGAFGADDWTANWANFNPQNEPYTIGYGVTPASISNTKLNLPLHIYPNPANENLVVNFTTNGSQEATITLLNVNGQVVASQKSKSVEHTLQFATTAIPSGFYMIQIATAQGVQFEKVQINHN
jgi:Secretion system C-terminal sorting domain